MGLSATRQDLKRFAEADMQFHRLLFEVAGSKRLTEMWELLSAPAQTLLVFSAGRAPDLAQGGPDRHNSLIQALQTRDPDTVERAMKDHLTAARERTLIALPAH
jgi:GntR family transcriptional regulator of gluconate operon